MATEIIDPELPPKIDYEPFVIVEHPASCPAAVSARSVPGHPVLNKLCNCGALKKPGPLELDACIRVRGSEDVRLHTWEKGAATLYLAVGGYDGLTFLTPAAARVIGSKLLQWAASMEER